MSTITEQHMLIFTDVDKNNNKFWEGILRDDDTLTCRWGRVGETGQILNVPSGGSKKLQAKLREKKRKGYEEAKILNSIAPAANVGKSVLKNVATKQINHGSCPETSSLIEFLVKVNRHQISSASGGKIVIDENDNLIRTPLGVVNQEAIDAARLHLTDIGDCVQIKSFDTKKWKEAVNKFTRLIPQDVGRGRGWDKKLFPNIAAVRKQNDLLDSLQTTLTYVLTAPVDDSAVKEDEVFKVKLIPIVDDKILTRIRSFYYKSVKKMHSSYGMKIQRAWAVDIETMRKKYEADGAKMENIWELWHGTKASNVLSILKGGLVIPPSTAGHVCGRMFGDGLYFSDQSTKSLNYATGYWDGKTESRCFMFMTDVAMGNAYVPKSTYWGQSSTRKCPDGYDSTFAKADISGVRNNEMIVYRDSQANLKFLVEFSR